MSKNNSSFGRLNVLEIISSPEGRVCFLGVGGVSMSSLLVLSAHFGIRTLGVDGKDGEYIRELMESGEDVRVGRRELPSDVKLLVYTLAADENDPMIREAEKKGVPCVSRAEYMSALSDAYRLKIAVSGTHGKSTVTAMLHHIFSRAALNPTTLSGARLGRGMCAYHVGSLDLFLYEACEYKDSFLAFDPSIALFLNLEYDHVDYFENEDQLEESFLHAAEKAGHAIINADDEKLLKIARKLHTPPIKVGKSIDCEYRYAPISGAPSHPSARFFRGEELLGEISLSLLGEFNLLNAVMACACAVECGVDFFVCRRALAEFSGIPTRLERVGTWQGREIYFDYAHHPTEIKEGIKAIKSDTGGDLTLIFGPHTYSRTKKLFDFFAKSLSLADHILITEIDAVREAADESISSAHLAERVGGRVVRSTSELEAELARTTGAIAVMGAADLGWVKEFLKNR